MSALIALLIVLALGALALAYGQSMQAHTRCPPRVVIPVYEPGKVSAGLMRWLYRRRYDTPSLSASLLSLASRGLIRLQRGSDRRFTLSLRSTDTPQLPDEEAAVLEVLHRHARIAPLRIEPANHQAIAELKQTHHRQLKAQVDGPLLFRNVWIALPLLLPLIAALFLALHALLKHGGLLAPLIGLALFALASRGYKLAIGAASVGLIVLLILHDEQDLALILPSAPPLIALLAAAGALGLINRRYGALFAPLATRQGCQLLDHMQGFRRYLERAELEDLQTRHAGKSVPEVLETLLPYAAALGLMGTWVALFNQALAAGLVSPQTDGGGSTGGDGFSGIDEGLDADLDSDLSDALDSSDSSSDSSGDGGDGGGDGGGGGD